MPPAVVVLRQLVTPGLPRSYAQIQGYLQLEAFSAQDALLWSLISVLVGAFSYRVYKSIRANARKWLLTECLLECARVTTEWQPDVLAGKDASVPPSHVMK